MANPIKYNVSTETLALKKGNFWIGTGDVGKGPTNVTGYYNGITPPVGGFTIYLNKATSGPSIYTVSTEAQLVSLTNTIGAQSFTTSGQCLNWFATQTDKMIFNIDYPAIVTDGLVLNLDAGFTPSYPTTNTTWYDVSGGGNNGTLINGPTFSSGNGGSIVFDGIDDAVTLGDVGSLSFTNGIFSTSVWLKIPSTWTGGSQYPNLVSKGAYAGWDTNGWSVFIFRNRGSGTGYSTGIGVRNGDEYLSGQEVYNLPTNTIFNVVATAEGSGNSIKVYINGVVSLTGTQTINPASNNDNVTIARGPTSQWFPGNIYLTQIYNRTLSSSEVLQNFNATKGRFGLQ